MIRDSRAGFIIELRPEGADLHAIAAVAQTPAGGADVKLPVHATWPKRLGNGRTRSWNGPSDCAQPFLIV